MAYTVAQAQADSDTGGPLNVDLYTVPAATEAVISTLAVANTTSSAVTYRIFIRVGGAPASQFENALVYDSTVSPNNTSFLTIGVALAADDIVTVLASQDDVVFTAFVNESEV